MPQSVRNLVRTFRRSASRNLPSIRQNWSFSLLRTEATMSRVFTHEEKTMLVSRLVYHWAIPLNSSKIYHFSCCCWRMFSTNRDILVLHRSISMGSGKFVPFSTRLMKLRDSESLQREQLVSPIFLVLDLMPSDHSAKQSMHKRWPQVVKQPVWLPSSMPITMISQEHFKQIELSGEISQSSW